MRGLVDLMSSNVSDSMFEGHFVWSEWLHCFSVSDTSLTLVHQTENETLGHVGYARHLLLPKCVVE
jgi:hypothetical protein